MSWKMNLIVVENVQALSLALLLFTYLILALTTAQIHYLETVHRVTLGKIFNQNVFGSVIADAAAAIGFFLLFIALTFRRSPLARLVAAALFAATMAAAVLGYDWLVMGALAGTLPVIAGFVLYHVRRDKMRLATSDEPILFRNKARGIESRPPGIHLPSAGKVGLAFLLVIIAVEAGALARWITYPFFPTEMYGDFSWRFAELESALFHSLGLLSPFLIVLIAFSFLYRWYIGDLGRKVSRIIQTRRSPDTAASLEESPRMTVVSKTVIDHSTAIDPDSANASVVATYAKSPSIVTIKQAHWIILSAALIIAPMVALYPHLPGVNPAGSGVSTDEQYYMRWMSALRADSSASWADTFVNAFTINNGDRPFTLLLILALANVTGSPDLMIIRYLPTALAPVLVLGTYMLLRFSLKSEDQKKIKFYASIGAIFAAFSPQLVVGEYAGLLSNWLALIPTYFAFYFLIKSWDSPNRNQMIYNLGILFSILLLIMLLHLYTWAHMLTVILLFAAISFLFAHKSVTNPRIKVALMLAVVVTSFMVDYARSTYLATPAAAAADSAIGRNIEPQDTAGRWDRLFFTLTTFVGGFLSNPGLILLSLLWVVKADLSKGLDRLMLSVFFILAIPIAVGSIEFQTRVLYNIPFHITALLALYGAHLKRWDSHHLLILALALTFATYALRAMANLYLELPEGFTLDKQFLLP